MGHRKTIFMAIFLIVSLFLLYPSRQFVADPLDAKVVEIVYMGPGGALTGAAEDTAREFERLSLEAHRVDPSKPIYRIVSGQNAARDQTADPTRFLVSVAGGTPPDVIYFDRFATAEWAARGAFVPLDPLIAADKIAGVPDAINPADFYKSAWDEGSWEGHLYGVPCSIDNRALIYNKDLFIRAGIVDEHGETRPPRTWDDLLDCTQKLTEHDSDGRLTRAGFLPNYGNSWLYMYGWMNGAKFMSADGRTVLLNEPAVVEALAYIKKLYEISGGFADVMSFQSGFQGGAQDPFITGKVAMKIDGYWCLGAFANIGKNLNFGIAPPPRPASILKQQGDMSWSGGWVYAIPATAHNKTGAWEFIRFMLSRNAIRIRYESERATAEAQGQIFIPAQDPRPAINAWAYHTYIQNNPQIPSRFADAIKQYNDLLPVAKFRPVTPVGQLLWNEHVTATETALYGRLSPQAALDRGNATVQRALDRFHSEPKGFPVTSWSWFFAFYACLILLVAAVVFAFDTSLRFRWTVYALIPLPRQNRDTLVDGATGGHMRSQWFGGYVCAFPWILGFIIFGGGPMLFSLLVSFSDYDILSAPRLTGVDNYTRLLTSDSLFWTSLENTLYMVIAVPLGLAVSLAIALLLNQNIRAVAVWRTLFYLPAIVPMVASSVLWFWIFNPQAGLLNGVLATIGIHGPRWLQDENWSKPSLILMGLWSAGSGMIIWLAGLKSIPASLYEAAKVDGAGPWQQFRHITIPQLTPYIFFNLTMGLISTFQIFGQAYIMTQGGPVNSTTFYVYYLFNQAFRYGNMGLASAMGWILFLIVLAITIAQLKLSKRWVHYESD